MTPSQYRLAAELVEMIHEDFQGFHPGYRVEGITVPNSGHWIPEEQPDFLVKLLNNFFSGNSTSTVGRTL